MSKPQPKAVILKPSDVADSDEVAWFGEAWPFSSDATCNEGRVLFGFLFGRAFMPHEIVGANLSD